MSRDGRDVRGWKAEAREGHRTMAAHGTNSRGERGEGSVGMPLVGDALQPGEVVAHGRDPGLFQVEKRETHRGREVASGAGDVVDREVLGGEADGGRHKRSITPLVSGTWHSFSKPRVGRTWGEP